MYELPTTVNVLDREYRIRKNGDYRLILDIIKACNDPELTELERTITILMLFYDDIDSEDDILLEFETSELLDNACKQVMSFINCGDIDQGYNVRESLLNWETDETLIVSAINPMLGQGQDIRMISYMHWWTFISYYMGIRESALSNVVDIRSKIVRGKKLEKYEQEFKKSNPQYFNWRQDNKSQEQKDFEDNIMKLWGK